MERKITPLVVKAESALHRLQRNWQTSTICHNARWAERRLRLIAGLPAEVQRALVRMEVLSGDDVKDAVELGGRQ